MGVLPSLGHWAHRYTIEFVMVTFPAPDVIFVHLCST